MSGNTGGDEEYLVEDDELAYTVEIPSYSYSNTVEIHPEEGVRTTEITPDICGPSDESGGEKITLDNSHTKESTEKRNGIHSSKDVRTPITNVSSGDAAATDTAHPVYYSSRNGNARVVQERVVVTRDDGTRTIEVEEMRESDTIRRLAEEAPLRQSRIRLLKVFSIVAIIIFFPCGIPAFYYSVKTEKEYATGILRGDIDLARKYARRSERFSILAGLLGLLTAILALALIERLLVLNDEKYWESSRNRLLLH